MNMLATSLKIVCRARRPRRAARNRVVPGAPALFAILCGSVFFCSCVSAQTLRIAAASDLQFVLPALAAQYEKQSGVKLAITYGSSGNFVAQIQNGAPFDLFFSADVSYPHQLAVAQLADVSSLQVYAVGHLVLWLPPDSPLDPSGGLKILLDPRIQKIAIANPDHAPYGRAAVAALRAEASTNSSSQNSSLAKTLRKPRNSYNPAARKLDFSPTH